jgi:large-conductance mechanosensitive channel
MNKTIEYLNKIINEISNLFNILIKNIINFLIINLKDFIYYLEEKKIINLAIGILLGTQLSKITNAITEYIFSPIIEKSSTLYNGKLENLTYKILNIEFKIGKIFIVLIQSIMILFFIYSFWKFSSTELKNIENILINIT